MFRLFKKKDPTEQIMGAIFDVVVNCLLVGTTLKEQDDIDTFEGVYLAITAKGEIKTIVCNMPGDFIPGECAEVVEGVIGKAYKTIPDFVQVIHVNDMGDNVPQLLNSLVDSCLESGFASLTDEQTHIIGAIAKDIYLASVLYDGE